MADLLRRAWDAKGHHLRLEALEMVERNGCVLEPALADELRSVICTFETPHLFLQ